MVIGMLILRYFIEVLRLCIGLEVFFKKKIKSYEKIFIMGIVYTSYMIVTSNEEILLVYLFASATTYLLFEGRRGEKLFEILILLCSFGVLDEIIGIVIKYCSNDHYIRNLSEASVVLLLIILKKIHIENSKMQRIFLHFIKEKIIYIVLCMIIILVTVIVGLNHSKELINRGNFNLFVDCISFMALVGMIILMAFIVYIKNSNDLIVEQMETERLLKNMQEKYYQELLAREEETRRYRHDMQNHLICLTRYIETYKQDEAIKYINQLQDYLVAIQKKCYFSGNELLDIFLNYYLSSLEDVDIKIIGICNDDIMMDKVDFCIIFSNLIQNAVEAVSRQTIGGKYIRVTIKQRMEHSEIEIRNSLDVNSKVEEKTVKRDKTNHGIGLKNVSDTVLKNGGYFKYGLENQEFFVVVILNRNSTS